MILTCYLIPFSATTFWSGIHCPQLFFNFWEVDKVSFVAYRAFFIHLAGGYVIDVLILTYLGLANQMHLCIKT